MLQVTERVFDNGKLVGYKVTDGQSTQIIDKSQAWLYAKDKQLFNVKAIGDISNPGLSGTNGFELKRLPDTELKSKFNYNTQDLYAAGIRSVLKNQDRYSLNKEDMKQSLKMDIDNGVLTPENCRTFSKQLVLEKVLCADDTHAKVVGYKIRYTGDGTLMITRVRATDGKILTGYTGFMESGESKCLNRAEVAILVSEPEIGGTLSNAKLQIAGYKTPNSLYDMLSSWWLQYTGTNMESNEGTPENIMNEKLEPEELKTYFLPELDSYNTGKNTGNYDNDEAKMALVRYTINTGKIINVKEDKSILGKCLRTDVQSGVMTPENRRSLCDSIVVENTLTEPSTRNLVNNVIGYKIKNVGSQPIDITRMTATQDHSTSQETIHPGQSMCINRAEMIMLASKPEFGGRLANGKMHMGTTKDNSSVYNWLSTWYFNGYDKAVYDMLENIYNVESPNNISKYFVQNNNDSVQSGGAQNKTVSKLKQKGIMAGFKRS